MASASSSSLLSFASEYRPNKYILLDVSDNDVLSDLTSSTLKCDQDGRTVLATPTKTYELVACRTTNEMLLLPPSEGEAGVDLSKMDRAFINERTHIHLETARIWPRFDRLSLLLASSSFRRDDTPEEDADRARSAPTQKLLEDSCLASPAELKRELRRRGAVFKEETSTWRVIDPSFLIEVFHQVLLELESRQWNILEAPVSAKDVVSHLSEFNPQVVRAALLAHAKEEADDLDAKEELWLDPRLVVRFRALKLLTETPSVPSIDEFFKIWKEACPTSLAPIFGEDKGRSLLRGLVLFNEGSGTCRYFPVDALPVAAAQRFDALFQAKKEWTLDELSQFLEGVDGVSPGGDYAPHLKRFCRSALNNQNVRVYMKR